METKTFDFQRRRDFSGKLNATFSFVAENFRTLFKSILYIAGPPVLVASLLLSTFMSDFFSMSLQAGRGNEESITTYFTSVNFWLQIGLAMVFFVVSMVVTTSTLNNYLILYREKGNNKIDVSEVWQRVKNTFTMYLGTTLMLGVLAIVTYVVMFIPMFILGAISPFLIFFGVIFLIWGVLYLYINVSLVYVIQAFENKGFFHAIARSFFLIRDKWWSTFGVIVVLSMLVGVISSLFFIPAYVILILQSVHNLQTSNFQEPSGIMGIVVVVFMTLYYLCQMILTCLPNLGLAFQYFNLVELKEAKGLMNDIANFGQQQPAPAADDQY